MSWYQKAILFVIVSLQALFFVIPEGPDGFIYLSTITFSQLGLVFLLFRLGEIPLKFVIFSAIAIRLLVAPTQPVFEDDFYRYLWDGHVLANGVNPYLYPPSHEALDPLDTDYRENIGFLHIRTIYPPLAEFLFAASNLIFSDSLLGMKLLFLLFDVLTGFLVVRWLALLQRPISWSFFYWFHPTVIKEIANSAHVDSVMVFFSTLGAYWLHKQILQGRANLRPWVAFALSIQSKVTSALLFPIFFRHHPHRWSGSLIAGLLVIGISIPLWGEHFMNGMQAFSKYWVYNEGLFYPISFLSNELIIFLGLDNTPFMKTALLNEYPGRVVSLFLLMLFALWRFLLGKKDIAYECMWLFAVLLLLSPVFNAWYALWFLPFAVVSGHLPLIGLAGLTTLAYSWYWDKSIYPYLQLVEYSIFALGLLINWLWSKRRSS